MTDILTNILLLMLVQWLLRLPLRRIPHPKHTVGNAVSAFLRYKGKKKTKTCSFFLELRSVGAALVEMTIKQNEQTKKNRPV